MITSEIILKGKKRKRKNRDAANRRKVMAWGRIWALTLITRKERPNNNELEGKYSRGRGWKEVSALELLSSHQATHNIGAQNRNGPAFEEFDLLNVPDVAD